MKSLNNKSIKALWNIYENHNREFIDFATCNFDSSKMPDSTINKSELKKLIFDHILTDLNLSKYVDNNRKYYLVSIDAVPESYAFYGEDAKDIDDTDINEFENFRFIKAYNKCYNKKTASSIFEDLMIYGGKNKYSALLNDIVNDVRDINPEAADKMCKEF